MFRKTALLFLFLIAFAGLRAQNSEYLDYIEKYKKIAVSEMSRAGIPASIKLAQALLESNAGKSELARKANNHFGIKCGNDWTGKSYSREDDDYDEFGNIIKSCFRRYKSSDDSFIAHSEFLRDPKKANRYGFLFRLNPMDYRRWATGLRTSGYATNATYDQLLIRIIEQYRLYEYDQLSPGFFPDGRPERREDLLAGLDLRRVNDVKVIFATNKITVQEISLKTGISVSRLARYNEQLPSPTDTLADGERIFIQPKRCNYRGKRKWHYMQVNEKLFDLSQNYGVKLVRLHKRNRIPAEAEPQVNERIKLKGFRIRKANRPRLVNEPGPTATIPPLVPEDNVIPTLPPISPTEPNVNPNQPEVIPTLPEVIPTQPTASQTHTVAKGDTLFSISRLYGVTVDQLIQLNKLPDTNIKIGQVLIVK